jgi:hypothetical protein
MSTMAENSPYGAWKCGGAWSTKSMTISIP